jgi:hypothetical protein
MRVMLAVHAFPPRSSAGAEIYTLRLGQALQGLAHEVRVLSAVHDLAARHGTRRSRAHAGLTVDEVVSNHQGGTLEDTYDDRQLAAAAEAAVDAFAPDCLHVQHFLNLAVGIAAAARRRGASTVMTLHDHWLGCARDGLRMRADLSLCETVDHRACAECLSASPYLAPPLQRGLAGVARRAGLGGYLHRIHRAVPRATETAMGLMRALAPEPGMMPVARAVLGNAICRPEPLAPER